MKSVEESSKENKPKPKKEVEKKQSQKRVHPLVTMYTSSDEDDSMQANTLGSNDDYGSYRPLKVDKMEVQINDKLVTEKQVMQLKTLNSLGSSTSRNQRHPSPRKVAETK